MTTDESIIHHQLDILVKRYQSLVTQENDIAQLVLKFSWRHWNILSLLLNYVRLDPGQAIFGCWRATCLYFRWYALLPIIRAPHPYELPLQNASNVWPTPTTSYARD